MKILEREANTKELHVWLSETEPNSDIETDYLNTLYCIKLGKREIHTTQPHFLQFKYGYRLIVHTHSHDFNGTEITLGHCIGTRREIKLGHNIEKMLFAGEFDWFTNKEREDD